MAVLKTIINIPKIILDIVGSYYNITPYGKKILLY